jgi:hypothetical protein
MLIKFTYTSSLGQCYTICGHIASLSLSSVKCLSDFLTLVEEPASSLYDCSRISNLVFRWDDTDLGI